MEQPGGWGPANKDVNKGSCGPASLATEGNPRATGQRWGSGPRHRAQLAAVRGPPPASEQPLQCWWLPLDKDCKHSALACGRPGDTDPAQGGHVFLTELDNEQLNQ